MEVREVRWSWLGEFDRKYRKLPPPPEAVNTMPPEPDLIRSSALRPKLNASLPAGNRRLPPSQWTAREVFTVGRKFKVLMQYSQGRARLLGPFIVMRHTPNSLIFRLEQEEGKDQLQRRSQSWKYVENLILDDRVRYLNNASPSTPTPR